MHAADDDHPNREVGCPTTSSTAHRSRWGARCGPMFPERWRHAAWHGAERRAHQTLAVVFAH
jgi:hypothetical protein